VAFVDHLPHLPHIRVGAEVKRPRLSMRFAPALALVVFLAWFATVPGAERSWLDIGVEATYLAAIAMGVNLLTGYTGLLSLGHAGFFVAGGYMGAVWVPAWGVSPWFGLPVAFAFGALLGGLLALLCCHLRGFYLTVVTLAFGSLMPALVVVLKSLFGGSAGRTVEHPLDVASLPFANGDSYRGLYVLSSAWMLITLFLCWNLVRSRWGRASMAIRESEMAAEASGVHTYTHKISAFAMSAGIVAVAGVMGAERFLLVSPAAGSQDQSFRYVIMMALGGLGTLAGPIIGAFSVTFGFGLDWMQTHFVNQQGLIIGLLGLVGVGLAPDGTMGNIRKALDKRAAKHPKPAPETEAAPVAELIVRDRGEQPALELTSITKRFGGLVALDNVDLVVQPGTVHGLIGPNGSGKTTMLNLISGVSAPSGGRLTIGGRDGGQASAHRRAALGVARTFQNLHLWKKMTVRENVLVGCHRSLRVNLFQAMFGTPAGRKREAEARAKADGLLALVGLGGRGDERAGALAFAEQRRLEIARALASDPDVLLLDEPAAGLHPADIGEFLNLLKKLKKTGLTILIVEHHMELLMKVCDRVSVLDFGQKIAEGTPRTIQKNKAVIAAYLGTEEEVA
jgi:branched-chain amino acid transport system permease protein